jgi:excisionase family DNA binding protein
MAGSTAMKLTNSTQAHFKETKTMNCSDAPNKRFLDVKEVAQEYGLAESTIYTMVSQRRIPHVKMGRRTKFDRKVLENWITQHSVEPIGPPRP